MAPFAPARCSEKGRRQITGFYFAGELVGLESTSKHAVGAQAITDAKVRIIKKPALNALASLDGKIADRLLWLMTRDLARKERTASTSVQERTGPADRFHY